MTHETDTKTDTQEKVVVIGAVIAGLIFFAALAFGWSGIGSFFKSGGSESEADLALAKANCDEKVSAVALESSKQIQSLSSDLAASEKELAALRNDFNLMKKEKTAAVTELNTAKTQIASAKSAKEQINRLYANISSLSSEKSTMKYKLKDATAALSVAEEQVEKLSGEVSGIAALKSLNTKQSSDIVNLKAEVNQYRAASNVFVSSSDDLPERARSLFSSLSSLEGKSEDELKSVYSSLKADNHSESLARFKFETGKADVKAADIHKIKSITSSSDPTSYFLIVGFADNTGSAEANEKLSSERATAVAKSFTNNKKGFQAAQAVYLGQTTRFGEPSENRVVEVWKISK